MEKEEDTLYIEDPWEIINEGGDLISYKQEKLSKLLDDIISKVNPESRKEENILENIQKAFQANDDIISAVDQFVEEAILSEVKTFIGFIEELQEDAKASALKTLTIITKLRENSLFLLIPLVENLTTEIERVEILVSKTSLEQMKEILEERKTTVHRPDRFSTSDL
jgi:N-methylhydantoinase B/oxoprolinase/acetone carboxylase alpha subunit